MDEEPKNESKQMTDEEYRAHLKEKMSPEDFAEWEAKNPVKTDEPTTSVSLEDEPKEEEPKEEEKKEEPKEREHSKTIAGMIRDLAKEGVTDIDKITSELKEEFKERDKEYLKVRAEKTLIYLKNRGELE